MCESPEIISLLVVRYLVVGWRVAGESRSGERGADEDGGTNEKRLVQTDGLAHRRLDVERLDVLPVLLEQGDEEVDA